MYYVVHNRVRWVVKFLTWGYKISMILSNKGIVSFLENKGPPNLKLAKNAIRGPFNNNVDKMRGMTSKNDKILSMLRV